MVRSLGMNADVMEEVKLLTCRLSLPVGDNSLSAPSSPALIDYIHIGINSSSVPELVLGVGNRWTSSGLPRYSKCMASGRVL